MPIYLYCCKQCEHAFEEQRVLAEYDVPTKVPCEKCGGEIYISLHRTGLNFDDRPHKVLPSWYTDRIKEIKKKFPGSTL